MGSKKRVRSLAFACFVFLFLSCVTQVRATTTVTFDGVWWQGLSADEQLAAVQGVIAGYENGFDDGATHEWIKAYDYVNSKYSKTWANSTWNTPHFTKVFKTYVDGIDDFYANHPEVTTKATIGEIIPCLADTPAITCDDVAKFAAKR